MPLTDRQRAYRRTPAERERRRQYAARRRKEPRVREAARLAQQRQRAKPGGAEKNRARVKANHSRLGRSYVTKLLSSALGIPSKHIPEWAVRIERDRLMAKRIANELLHAIEQEDEDEGIKRNDQQPE